jgi:hypothetical protein
MHDTSGSTAIDDFNPDNRAWRRFTTMTVEHLDLIEWTRDDGRPVMVSLVDLDSGDTVTVAVIDSLENRDPHALLAVTADGAMAAYGPFADDQAASRYAPALVLPGAEDADDAIIATCPAALHPTDQPALPGTAWRAIPDEIAASAHPAPGETGAAVLVLLDRTRAVATTVGPFDDHSVAGAWRPTPDLAPTADRLVIGLQAPPPPDTAG